MSRSTPIRDLEHVMPDAGFAKFPLARVRWLEPEAMRVWPRDLSLNSEQVLGFGGLFALTNLQRL
jgi:hypothetical protein